MDLDARVRRAVYDATTAVGVPPRIAELAASLGEPAPTVRDSLTRLAAGRVFVLQPTSGELLMVPPFSAVPTPFVVESTNHRAYANCMWDAIGASITLRRPVRVIASCACCGDQMSVGIRHDAPPQDEGLVHFAVPALRWWTDIVFT